MTAVVVDQYCETHGLMVCKCAGAARKKHHKYHAIPTTVDGIRFGSKKEAKEYRELCDMELADVIHDLRVHPRFELNAPNGTKIGIYEADFSYEVPDCGKVIIDVKGMWTPLAKWKIKHFEAQYGMKVRIVK